MTFTKINCLNCQKECYTENREINRGNGKYCSRQCSAKHTASMRPKPEPNVTCAWCDVKFYKNISKQKGSRSQLYFCCRAHKDEAQRIGGIKEIMPDHYGQIYSSYRDIVFKLHNKPKICERCGFDKDPAIIVHHKDRNRSNNDISNLEVLCCNCHAIEHWGDHL